MAADDREAYFGSSLTLLIATAIGLGTGVIFPRWSGPTGDLLLDGGLTVAIGLYVCSHPAVNLARALLLDLLPASSVQTGRGPIWILLNVSSVIAGWFAIVVGLSAFLQ